jgi:tRNA threonylcarbamoyladenosine biosynthesis protein TsaB
MILAIRTDQPEAHIALLEQAGGLQKGKHWLAGRQLSVQLIPKILDFLAEERITAQELTAIIVFQGPGSYTGLRIGISVANALAYSLDIPIVTSQGDNWIKDGVSKIANQKQSELPVIPHYGGQPHVTQQKK